MENEVKVIRVTAAEAADFIRRYQMVPDNVALQVAVTKGLDKNAPYFMRTIDGGREFVFVDHDERKTRDRRS